MKSSSVIPRSRLVRIIAVGLALSLASVATLADVVAVVSARSTVITLSKSQVADLFLGRTSRFPNGVQAMPIDQLDGSVVHDDSSVRVLL